MPRDSAEIDPVAAMVEQFNRRYMVVNEAGKALVYESVWNPMLKRQHYVRLDFGDLRKLYMNRHICVGVDEKKQPVMKLVAVVWLTHPDRREYTGGVVFDPSSRHVADNVLNLWQGYAIQARPGSWTKMQDHILNVICGGNQDYNNWLTGWMARLMQRPAEQGEVAIVLKGIEGTGKGILARALMHIHGQHALAISNAKHLIGNFNGHLRDCVFLFSDEAFFAGDRAHVGVLKSIITEPTLTVEAKYQNAVQMPNFIHLMMASNEHWVVPAGLEARRFFVLEVSPERANDHAYFAAIQNELDSGGHEAMLHDLMAYDLTAFNHRAPPKTAGLDEQKKLSLGSSEAWWMDVLHRGYVYRSRLGLEDFFNEWHDAMTTEVLFVSYEAYAKDRRERHPMSRERFGKFMRDVVGATGKRLTDAVIGEHIADVKNPYGGTSRQAELIKQSRPPGYVLGTLDEARQAFMTSTELAGDWPREEPTAESQRQNRTTPDRMPDF